MHERNENASGSKGLSKALARIECLPKYLKRRSPQANITGSNLTSIPGDLINKSAFVLAKLHVSWIFGSRLPTSHGLHSQPIHSLRLYAPALFHFSVIRTAVPVTGSSNSICCGCLPKCSDIQCSSLCWCNYFGRRHNRHPPYFVQRLSVPGAIYNSFRLITVFLSRFNAIYCFCFVWT